MATKGRACRACGVVFPEGLRCPSCGTWAGRRLVPALACASIAALAISAAWALARAGAARDPSDPALVAKVQAGSTAFKLSSNQRQTDVSGFVVNENAIAVDVTVRVRAKDSGDNVVADLEIGPIRDLKPGAAESIRATLDLAPAKSVAVDAVRVVPSRP